jgi:hypothetical protein
MKQKITKILLVLGVAIAIVSLLSCKEADDIKLDGADVPISVTLTTSPVPTKTAVPTSSTPIVVTSTPSPISAETATAIPPTGIPLPTPTPTGPPGFANLRFAAAPDAEPRRAFGYGTDEVYALWEYSNMNENIIVHRRWDLAGEEVIREEAWDMETYGASGTVSNIFIFDYENEGGLSPGLYSLDLYIDDQRVIFAPFSINGSWLVTHEGTGRRAFVEDNSLLMIEESDGQQRQVAEALEIRELIWMPDGRYLLYSEWDRTDQMWHTSIGLEQKLWLVDVDTGEQIMLGERYHTPVIGSDGRYLAVYVGSDFHDACGFDRQQRFLQLDGAIVAQYELADFAAFPMDVNDTFVPNNGHWQSESEFIVEIEALCDYDTGNNAHAFANEGIYRFDLAAMTAERIGDLPEE